MITWNPTEKKNEPVVSLSMLNSYLADRATKSDVQQIYSELQGSIEELQANGVGGGLDEDKAKSIFEEMLKDETVTQKFVLKDRFIHTFTHTFGQTPFVEMSRFSELSAYVAGLGSFSVEGPTAFWEMDDSYATLMAAADYISWNGNDFQINEFKVDLDQWASKVNRSDKHSTYVQLINAYNGTFSTTIDSTVSGQIVTKIQPVEINQLKTLYPYTVATSTPNSYSNINLPSTNFYSTGVQTLIGLKNYNKQFTNDFYIDYPNSKFGNGCALEWKTAMPNLETQGNITGQTNPKGMFESNKWIQIFNAPTPRLKDGRRMFSWSNLVVFKGNLDSLEYGDYMFFNTPLHHFDTPTPALLNGQYMFAYENSGYLGLSSFRGRLDSLVNGYRMFSGCRLDLESLRCIAETIRDVQYDTSLGILSSYDFSNFNIHISMQKKFTGYYTSSTNASTPTNSNLKNLYNSYIALLNIKGWTVVMTYDTL